MSNQASNIPGGVQAGNTPILGGGGGGGGVASVTGSAPIASSGGANPNITISAATTLARGTMSAADKTKLDSVTAGAAVASVSGTAPIVSSGGTTPSISLANTTVTPGVYTNTNLTVDAQGRITAAANGSAGGVTSVSGTAPIVSSGGATPAISVNNTGNTAGRADLWVLLDRQTLAAAGSYTGPGWAAKAYKRLRLYVKGTDSAGLSFGNMSMTGLTGTNNGYVMSNTTSVDNRGVAMTGWLFTGGASPCDFFVRIEIEIDVSGGSMRKVSYTGRGESMNSVATIVNHTYGDNTDTTHDPTNLTIALNSFTGYIELEGMPA